MAQDAPKAADAASPRARQERMASVSALPLTGLQLPGAPEMIEPSERLEADCQDQVQALAQEILKGERPQWPQERHRQNKELGGRTEGRRAPGQVGEQRSQALCPRLRRPPKRRGHRGVRLGVWVWALGLWVWDLRPWAVAVACGQRSESGNWGCV
jgi:hypothetical protein